MDNITITDLFFWVTGIAVIFITILLAIAIVYLIIFLRTIKAVARQAQRASQLVTEDLSELRQDIKAKGFNLKSIIKFLFGIVKAKQTTKRK